jgi:hypothetical protein
MLEGLESNVILKIQEVQVRAGSKEIWKMYLLLGTRNPRSISHPVQGITVNREPVT